MLTLVATLNAAEPGKPNILFIYTDDQSYVGKWHMGSQRERPGFDYHATYSGHGQYADCPYIVDGKDVPTSGWIDDVATDYAIGFIEKQKDSARPWSLILGFKTPHQPWEPPARSKDLYAGEVARNVPNVNTPPICSRKQIQVKKEEKPVPPSAPTNLDYFRCVTAMDDCLGRLLKALDQSGFAYDESLRVPFLVR